MNTAHIVSTFADSEIKAAAGNNESEVVALHRAWKVARENGGRARTSKGDLLGYRFPDGSAITANCVEFLGTFKGERGYTAPVESPTPITDSEIRAAADKAMDMAKATLARELPFLGVMGAAERSGITDDAMGKVCGYAYLYIVQANTTSITTDESNYLTTECIK